MRRTFILAVVGLALGAGCKTDYDEPGFRKAIEQAYAEAHPGWTILRKKDQRTWFHRGAQLDELDVAELFAAYKASGKAGSDYLADWTEAARTAYEAQRRTLEEAGDDVVPLIKSEKWVQYRDLGAIGPARRRAELRPWREAVTPGVFVVLGVPEGTLGVREASMAEMEASKTDDEAWLKRAIANLRGKLSGEVILEDGSYGGVPVELHGQLKAFDLNNGEGVSGLILDPTFRKAMLSKFGLDELGAAVPIRDVLIVFDPNDFVAVKPARNRAHQLYDTQNHPGFRGLLRFDAESIHILEPAEGPERRR